MTTYPPPSPPFIAARWHGGPQRPHLIVMHSTVSPCRDGQARATAKYFARIETKASAHYCVDPAEVVQCVGDHTIAYHCGHNSNSIGVEMCEYPSRINLARWLTRPHRRMKARAVRLVARLCLAYDIPPYYVDAAGLRAGKRGVTTHAQMTAAFRQSTHWDPGSWPRVRFMRAVRAEIAKMKEAAR